MHCVLFGVIETFYVFLFTIECQFTEEFPTFNSLDMDAPPYGASAVGRHTRMCHLLAHQH